MSLADAPLSPDEAFSSAPAKATTAAPDWLSDFLWAEGRIKIRKTGICLKIDHHLINEVASWIVYLSLLGMVVALRRFCERKRPAIWYAPDIPRPWYLIRGTALWAGMRVAKSPLEASASVYFDDTTIGEPPVTSGGLKLNHGCTDISKGHVAKVFEEVFGYPLRIDPMTASGPIVEKSETNGVHDGRVITAPTLPREGFVYQRVVDTQGDDGSCRDLRTPCVGGEPIVVWIKVKRPAGRFAIHNKKATLADPSDVYSPSELQQIKRFTARMGLDWGGLDILRDRNDGRIYIVDVNKTDLGPVIAMSWKDKIISMHRLSQALRRLILRSV